MKKKNLFTLLLIIVPCLIFWQFFLNDAYPFPGSYHIAWFEPWKTDNFINNTIVVSHKPISHDVFRQIFPFKLLAIDYFKNISLPLWNPYNGSGMPLMATANIGFLDPLNLIFLFFPTQTSWSISIIIQMVLITFFTYLYCRKISLSKHASLFSSFVFLFSGFVIIRSSYQMYNLAISTIPLNLFLIETFFKNTKTKLIYLLPFSIATSIFSTQPQLSLYVISFTFIYLIFRIFGLKNHNTIKFKNIFFLLFLVLIGIGISSVQLFPTYELYQHANISAHSSHFIIDRFLLPLKHFITIFIPNYFGNPSIYNYWEGLDYEETIMHIGLIPCFFVFYAFLNKDKKYKNLILFYSLSVLISFLLMLNWSFSNLFYSLKIPLISTGNPARLSLLLTFSLAIFSGIGFEYFSVKKIIRKKLLVSILFIFILIALIFTYTNTYNYLDKPCTEGIIANCKTVSVRNTLLEVFFFLISIPLLGFALIKKRGIILACLISLILIQGYYNSYKFLAFSPKETFYPKNELISVIKKLNIDKNSRFFGLEEANIKTNFATYFKFYDPQYYHPLYIKRYGEIVSFANKNIYPPVLQRSDVEIINTINPDEKLKKRRDKLFSILGINYLIYKNLENLNEDMFWHNNNWSIQKINNSRINIVTEYEIENNDKKTLEKLFKDEFKPDKKVFLKKEPQIKIEGKLENKNAKIIEDKGSTLSLLVNIDQNAILVISDNYYPGWKAFIDNKETEIFQANYNFRAIIIPKGNHVVKFIYQPSSVRLGLLLSFFSIATLLIFYFFARNHMFK